MQMCPQTSKNAVFDKNLLNPRMNRQPVDNGFLVIFRRNWTPFLLYAPGGRKNGINLGEKRILPAKIALAPNR